MAEVVQTCGHSVGVALRCTRKVGHEGEHCSSAWYGQELVTTHPGKFFGGTSTWSTWESQVAEYAGRVH